MADIGATLREARTQRRLDVTDVESETKIRAKYLRALENEEWDLLPGPTYVKSFLRTYAEALGLDGRMLVEEYKLRHERLSDIELQPIRPPSVREPRRRRGRRSPGAMRGVALAAVVIGILAGLYALGRDSDDSDGSEARTVAPPVQTSDARRARESDAAASAAKERRRRRPRLARLRIVPVGAVYVCLKRAGGDTVVNGTILLAGSRQPLYRSRRFRLLLGNSEVRLRINGRTRRVAPSAGPIGYEITPTRTRLLRADQFPQCTTGARAPASSSPARRS